MLSTNAFILHVSRQFFFLIIVRNFSVAPEDVQFAASAFVVTHHRAYLLSDARGGIIAERSLSLLLILASPPVAFQAFPLYPRILPLAGCRTGTTWLLWRAYQRANPVVMPISATLSYSCKTPSTGEGSGWRDYGGIHIAHFSTVTNGCNIRL